MNWLLDNLQLVVIVASAFAWWWSQRRGGGGTDSAPPEAERPETTEYEEMERTRRIQEEIRRKIAERNARGPRVEREPPPVPEREHRPREVPPPLVETLRRLAPDWVEEDRAAQERQQQLEEQMRALEEQRRAARVAAQEAAAAAAKLHHEPARGGRATPVGQLPLRQTLRDPRSLRQAVLLREVLGPPVGLR